jgi:sulfate adenylyltransferase subunit 2
MNDVSRAVLPPRTLTHLERLEAESIQIIREVAAEFRNPVMLYSIGKDSGVMVHLAIGRRFYPGKLPFPLLHVDTLWKFRDMIAHRDRHRGGPRREAPDLHEPGRSRARHRPHHAPARRSTRR